jgi:hypothetical protein
LLAGALVTACASTRPPLDVTRARLAAAATPEARVAVAVERLAGTGAAPLAHGRVRPASGAVFTFGTPAVVGAIVPGQVPVRRLELVTLATALDGTALAETIEAARALVAARPDGRPRRSVLVAAWPAGLDAEAGLARIAAVPVWPESLRVATVVVGAQAPAGTVAVDPAGLVGAALVARIVEATLVLADRDSAAAIP